MKLVDNAGKWYKMATIQFWILIGVLAQVVDVAGHTIQSMLPTNASHVISVIALISVGLRLWRQENVSGSTSGNS